MLRCRECNSSSRALAGAICSSPCGPRRAPLGPGGRDRMSRPRMSSIEDYLAALDETQRAALTRVVAAIRRVCQAPTESISVRHPHLQDRRPGRHLLRGVHRALLALSGDDHARGVARRRARAVRVQRQGHDPLPARWSCADRADHTHRTPARRRGRGPSCASARGSEEALSHAAGARNHMLCSAGRRAYSPRRLGPRPASTPGRAALRRRLRPCRLPLPRAPAWPPAVPRGRGRRRQDRPGQRSGRRARDRPDQAPVL